MLRELVKDDWGFGGFRADTREQWNDNKSMLLPLRRIPLPYHHAFQKLLSESENSQVDANNPNFRIACALLGCLISRG